MAQIAMGDALETVGELGHRSRHADPQEPGERDAEEQDPERREQIETSVAIENALEPLGVGAQIDARRLLGAAGPDGNPPGRSR